MKQNILTLALTLSGAIAWLPMLAAEPATPESTETQTITEVRDSTINALDYVLQKPAPFETFENKKFGDHLFLNMYGGGDWTRNKVEGFLPQDPTTGWRIGASVGDWITPIHGWRLNLEMGQHYGVYKRKPDFIGISADYLMNLTNLVKGDNRNHRFEILMIGGLDFELLRQVKYARSKSIGLRMAFQPRFYFTPTTYMFIEPRIGIYTDGVDSRNTWHRNDWNASLLVGLGYRMRPFSGFKVDNSLFDNSSFRNNLFIGVGGGVGFIPKEGTKVEHSASPYGNIFIGKWFNAASALKLSVGGIGLHYDKTTSGTSFLADLDYVWNLNSSFVGYNPDRRTAANVILGATLVTKTFKSKNLNPGLHFGVQGILNINRNIGLFVQPEMRILKKCYHSNGTHLSHFVGGASAGIIYRTSGGKDYNQYRATFDREDFLASRKFFFEAKGGVIMQSYKWDPNHAFSVSFGQWFAPGNGWRISGEYDYIRPENVSPYRAVTGSIDYLGSLSTLAGGWNDERVFDLSAFVGIGLGMAHHNSRYNDVIWGPRLGLRGAFRLSSAVDLFLEPRIDFMRIPDLNKSMTPEVALQAGLSYKFGRTTRNTKSDEAELHNEEMAKNFVSFGIGPSLFCERLINSRPRDINWVIDVTVGRWLTSVSGLQAGLSYDFIDRGSRRNSALNIGTVHADYLLNLTTLANGDNRSRFNLIAFVGAGIGWSNQPKSKISPELEAGFQAKVRVMPNLNVTFTPTVAFWRHTVNPQSGFVLKLTGVGRLPIGVSYTF